MDTNCKKAELWISIRADGERLFEDDARRLDEHLGVCAACRDLLEVETRRTALLESVLGNREAEARLSDAVVHAFRREGAGTIDVSRRFGSPFARGRWVLAAAALLLIGFGTWSLLSLPQSSLDEADVFGTTPRREIAPPPFRLILDVRENSLDPGPDGLPRLRQDRSRHMILVPGELEPDGPDLRMETRERNSEFLRFTDWKYY